MIPIIKSTLLLVAETQKSPRSLSFIGAGVRLARALPAVYGTDSDPNYQSHKAAGWGESIGSTKTRTTTQWASPRGASYGNANWITSQRSDIRKEGNIECIIC